MSIRLGDVLVKRGLLSEAQRDSILDKQREVGRPFGELAEGMFGVHPDDVERAWAHQYAAMAPHIDPAATPPEASALRLISARQAWQFRVLPLCYQDNELVVCTTEAHLVRALKFAGWRLGEVCTFVITDDESMGQALDHHYPIAGLSPKDLNNPFPVEMTDAA